jgi:hypothetical protein
VIYCSHPRETESNLCPYASILAGLISPVMSYMGHLLAEPPSLPCKFLPRRTSPVYFLAPSLNVGPKLPNHRRMLIYAMSEPDRRVPITQNLPVKCLLHSMNTPSQHTMMRGREDPSSICLHARHMFLIVPSALPAPNLLYTLVIKSVASSVLCANSITHNKVILKQPPCFIFHCILYWSRRCSFTRIYLSYWSTLKVLWMHILLEAPS